MPILGVLRDRLRWQDATIQETTGCYLAELLYPNDTPPSWPRTTTATPNTSACCARPSSYESGASTTWSGAPPPKTSSPCAATSNL